jgi:thymidylate kinase
MSKEHARLVCLVGIDGAGKTCHARRLVAESLLSARSRYLWLRETNSFFSIPFMALCRILGLTEVHHLRNGVTCTEHRYYRNKAVATIWPWIQLVDAVIVLAFMVYIPIMRGSVLVCDRYVHDLLVDLMADTGNSDLHIRMVGRLMLKLVPRGSLTFVLDADEDTILKRKSDIPSMQYLRRRRQLYRLIANYLDLPSVNCSQPFDAVHTALVRLIRQVSWS